MHNSALPHSGETPILSALAVINGARIMSAKNLEQYREQTSLHNQQDTDNGLSPEQQKECLIKIGAEKDKGAFANLFQHFAPRIKSFLMKGGLSAELSDELAQETMLNVWTKAEQYDPAQAAVSTWIFTIARNKRIDHLRKISRPELDPHDPAFTKDTTPAPGDELDRIQESLVVKDAIDTLPDKQKELIYMAYFEGKTHYTIAEEKKLPLGTVKSRLRLALERLRTNIKDM